MRLFLASHDFGNYKDELLKLMGVGRRALMIANARDFCAEDERKSVVSFLSCKVLYIVVTMLYDNIIV